MSQEFDKALLDEMVFDTVEPIQVPVTINGRKYVLFEASAGAATKYKNALLRATKMVDGKVVGMEGMADAEPMIVSMCLFHVTNLPNGQPGKGAAVPLPQILAWTNKVQKRLFERLKAISELDERDTEESLSKQINALQEKLDEIRKNGADKKELAAKNERSGSEDSSDSPTS